MIYSAFFKPGPSVTKHISGKSWFFGLGTPSLLIAIWPTQRKTNTELQEKSCFSALVPQPFKRPPGQQQTKTKNRDPFDIRQVVAPNSIPRQPDPRSRRPRGAQISWAPNDLGGRRLSQVTRRTPWGRDNGRAYKVEPAAGAFIRVSIGILIGL